ncbi:NUDIX hydrolase domain-like protein [Cladochytrium replicatum]|nr:NUDIX hydrolase domain-like protein [Cladochytrium replicatum]
MAKFKSFIELVKSHNTIPSPPPLSLALPLLLGSTSNVPLGYVRHAVASHLDGHDGITVNADSVRITSEPYTVTLANALEKLRAKAVKSDPVLRPLLGWRGERYPVYGEDGRTVVMECERSAAGLLGVRTYGCHLNGFTRDSEGKIESIWVARRSKTKQTYPGMLDNIVGGGLRAGTTAISTMLAECQEEASLQLKREELKFCGHVGYFRDSESRGWIAGIEYCYDWECKADGPKPQPCDGEVEGFYQMRVSEVIERLLDGEFTPSSSLVIVEFLVRHSVIAGDGVELHADQSGNVVPSPSYSTIICE